MTVCSNSLIELLHSGQSAGSNRLKGGLTVPRQPCDWCASHACNCPKPHIHQCGLGASNVYCGSTTIDGSTCCIPPKNSWRPQCGIFLPVLGKVVQIILHYLPLFDELTCFLVLAAFGLVDDMAVPEGGWLLQTAAGSVLGRILIAIAKKRGIKTINVIRRSEQKQELLDLGWVLPPSSQFALACIVRAVSVPLHDMQVYPNALLYSRHLGR